MKNHIKTEIKVGAAVGFTIFLLVISILMIGGEKSLFSKTYSVKSNFKKVESLSVGAVVRVSGYQVGNVSKIEFSDTENRIEVTMTLLEKYQNQISSSSKAELRTQGALGDKYIYIVTSDTPGEILKNGDTLPADESEDFLSALTGSGTDISKIFDILNELHVFSKTLNQDGRSERFMTNLVKASEEFQKSMHTLNLTLQDLRGEDGSNVRKISKNLANISEKLDNGGGTLGGLINDSSIHDRLKSILGGTQRPELKTLLQTTIQEGKK